MKKKHLKKVLVRSVDGGWKDDGRDGLIDKQQYTIIRSLNRKKEEKGKKE